MNINFVSYMILLLTLEINILLSSSGSLKASKIDFEKCGNSSKNNSKYNSLLEYKRNYINFIYIKYFIRSTINKAYYKISFQSKGI
jgi:hypothetical protein